MGFPLTRAQSEAISAEIDGQHELVVAVAIRTPLATITQPRPCRHVDCFPGVYAMGLDPSDQENSIHGFITNRGRFADRAEAAQVAIASGQCTTFRAMGRDGQTPHLFSEDLWNNPLEGDPA